MGSQVLYKTTNLTNNYQVTSENDVQGQVANKNTVEGFIGGARNTTVETVTAGKRTNISYGGVPIKVVKGTASTPGADPLYTIATVITDVNAFLVVDDSYDRGLNDKVGQVPVNGFGKFLQLGSKGIITLKLTNDPLLQPVAGDKLAWDFENGYIVKYDAAGIGAQLNLIPNAQVDSFVNSWIVDDTTAYTDQALQYIKELAIRVFLG